MKFLKTCFEFYLNSSIHVALAVYALMRITELYFNLPYQDKLNYFIFFSTITGYNFVKYAGVAKLHHRSLTNNLKVIQIFSLLAFIAMLYYAYALPLKLMLYFLPFGVLTLLYAVPFLSGFEKNLRQVSHLKNVVIAFVWAGTTVIIPLIFAEIDLNTSAFLYMLQRFVIVLALILPFDIRDLNFDTISLQTIPQRIGVEKTKKLGLTLLIFSLILEYLIPIGESFKTPYMLFVFVTIIFLMRSKTKQNKYYSSFWVEAIPIFWWLSVLIFQKIQ